MHRFLTLLLLLGVLAGLLAGRFVHFQHHEGSGCSLQELGLLSPMGQTGQTGQTGENQAFTSLDTSSGHEDTAGTKDKVCSDDAHGGQCHHHACQHTISPGIHVAEIAFFPISRLLGSVPAASVPAMDEPVYELDTPPLI